MPKQPKRRTSPRDSKTGQFKKRSARSKPKLRAPKMDAADWFAASFIP